VPAKHPVTRLGPSSVLRVPGLCELCEHPLVLGAAESLLTRHCKSIALKLVSPIWLPKQRRQLLHHEDGLWPCEHPPGHEWCVDVIWALDDFGDDNGSTIVVPGSCHWARSAPFTNRAEREVGGGTFLPKLQVTMARGSALLFTGATLHGGGENRTQHVRRSVLIGYQLGWLRPEHKFHAVRGMHRRLGQFSPQMQRLMGFDGVQNAAEGADGLDGDDYSYVCNSGNYQYLSRTPAQVASQTDAARHGGAGSDEPYYHGPLVIPAQPTAKHGKFITKLQTIGRL
jgi:hypothetical protein